MATFGTGLLRDYDTAKWIEDHDWQRDLPLAEGQRVRAARDLFAVSYAMKFSTEGVPVGDVFQVEYSIDANQLGRIAYHMGGNEYLVAFDDTEAIICKYNPRAAIDDDGWSFDTEIVLVDEPIPNNDPRNYMKSLFD